MNMNKITIKNISTATVVVVNDKFRRELAPGREVPITKAVYDDLMFDPGFNNLIIGHYIVVNGLTEKEQISDIGTIYDPIIINQMFDDKNYAAFAKFLPTATAAEKETVIKLAIDKGITDNGFTALIKKYCDIDVVSAINQKHQAEEK